MSRLRKGRSSAHSLGEPRDTEKLSEPQEIVWCFGGNGAFKVPYRGPYNPFPHSLLSTRQKITRGAKRLAKAYLRRLPPRYQRPVLSPLTAVVDQTGHVGRQSPKLQKPFTPQKEGSGELERCWRAAAAAARPTT